MNALKTTVAIFAIAAATAPAFASEGVPPDLQATWNASAAGVSPARTAASNPNADSREAATPQYLPGRGEVSLVPNPAFTASASDPTTRVTKSEIQRRSVPATKYVGA